MRRNEGLLGLSANLILSRGAAIGGHRFGANDDSPLLEFRHFHAGEVGPVQFMIAIEA